MEVWPWFKWLKVWAQPWEGDITMVMPASMWMLYKAIINPTRADLEQVILQVTGSACLPACLQHCLVPETFVWE